MSDSPEPISDGQEDQAAARVGMEIAGKWTLRRLLGVGGMASVYEAVHKNGRRVALKMLHPELSGVTEARERFLQESYAANRVAHEGAVPVLDDGVAEDGAPFLVMELLEGETLEARWQRHQCALPPFEVLTFMEQLLETLVAAHDHGIVHRDIKPENVFLTYGGDVKLLDFGIASMTHSKRHSRTQVGNTMGTPAFMPPEQARGRWEEVDEQSDIWSVGATMYALVAGRTVHDADTNNELLLASMTQPPAPVRTYAPELEASVAAVIDKAVAFEKTDRFVSCREMLEAVSRARLEMEGTQQSPGIAFHIPLAGENLRPNSVPPPISSLRPVVTASALGTELMERQHPRLRRLLWVGAIFGAMLSAAAAYRVTVASSSTSDSEPVSAVSTERPVQTEPASQPQGSSEPPSQRTIDLDELPDEDSNHPAESSGTQSSGTQSSATQPTSVRPRDVRPRDVQPSSAQPTSPTDTNRAAAAAHASRPASQEPAAASSTAATKRSEKAAHGETEDVDNEPFDPLSIRR